MGGIKLQQPNGTISSSKCNELCIPIKFATNKLIFYITCIDIMSSPFEMETRKIRVAYLQAIDSIKSTILEIPLERNRVISIGRGTHNDDKRVTPFVFNNMKISSTHCYIWSIQFDETTPCICYLKDVSTNHTYVNNKPIKCGEYVILNHNDEIEIINGFKGVFKYETRQAELLKSFNGLSEGKFGCWCIIPKILGSGSFGKVR